MFKLRRKVTITKWIINLSKLWKSKIFWKQVPFKNQPEKWQFKPKMWMTLLYNRLLISKKLMQSSLRMVDRVQDRVGSEWDLERRIRQEQFNNLLLNTWKKLWPMMVANKFLCSLNRMENDFLDPREVWIKPCSILKWITQFNLRITEVKAEGDL